MCLIVAQIQIVIICLVINETLRSVDYYPGKLEAESLNPNTPPNSSSSCDGDSQFSLLDSDSNSSSSSSPMASPVSMKSPASITTCLTATKPKRTYAKKGNSKKEAMLEKSRLMLCMFAMSILFFNPFSLILRSANDQFNGLTSGGSYLSGQVVHSRVLNAIDLYEDELSFNQSNPRPSRAFHLDHINLFSWIMNASLILICLIKIYINGEPFLEFDATSTDYLWKTYQQASRQFLRKDYADSFSLCQQGLKQLGQNTPTTKFQLVIGLIWQLLRFVLDKIYLGKLLSKLSVWFYGSDNLKMYKLSALFYYELHKFSYLNTNSEQDLSPKSTTTAVTSRMSSQMPLQSTTAYSYLTGFYYMLAAYNMSQVYTMFGTKAPMSLRDEYNLCEIYLSMMLYFKFFLPLRLSKHFNRYMLRNTLFKSMRNANEMKETLSDHCQLKKLKTLLAKSCFRDFLIEFDTRISLEADMFASNRQQTLNLISFKRKLFTTPSFLYDSDEGIEQFAEVTNMSNKVLTANGIACDYILSKFQEFILLKLTDHVINKSSVISIGQLLTPTSNDLNKDASKLLQHSNPFDLDDEQLELAEIDQNAFDTLVDLYKQNLDYFSTKKVKFSSLVVQETQHTLLQFLNMLNNWKLRKFDLDIQVETLKNSQNR